MKNENKKLLPHVEADIEQTCIEAIIKGYPKEEISDIVFKQFKISQHQFNTTLRKAYNKIKNATLVDLEVIVPLHIQIYEQIYKEFDELYYVPGKLKALKQKEKIVGFHKESNKIEVCNELNVEIDSEEIYDLSKLSSTEQLQLSNLIKKTTKIKNVNN